MKLFIRKKFSWGFAVLFILFLFQDPLTTLIPLVSYFDEIESVFLIFEMLFLTLISKQKVFFDKCQRKYILTFVILIIVGVIGNIISSYQTFFYVVLDILVYSKFTINLLFANNFRYNYKANIYEETAWKVASIVSIILIVLIIRENIFSPIWPYLDDRYGMKSLQLFFSNQTYLALIGVMLLTIHYNFGEYRKGTAFFCVLDMLISISTFRTKALGFVAISILIIFVIGRKKKITKMNIIFFGAIIFGVAIFVGYEYLNKYYLSANLHSIRFTILRGGLKLANNHVPFGTGFGTYCSLGAKLNYSQAYNLLGFQNIYHIDFMYDNFWASVLGQLGYLGICFYLLLLMRLVMLILKIRKFSTRKFWTCILLCAYLIIASLGESSFNSFYSCFMGLYIGYLYNSGIEIKEKV